MKKIWKSINRLNLELKFMIIFLIISLIFIKYLNGYSLIIFSIFGYILGLITKNLINIRNLSSKKIGLLTGLIFGYFPLIFYLLGFILSLISEKIGTSLLNLFTSFIDFYPPFFKFYSSLHCYDPGCGVVEFLLLFIGIPFFYVLIFSAIGLIIDNLKKRDK